MATADHLCYSSVREACRILTWLGGQLDPISLPPEVHDIATQARFTSTSDHPYFPIPFKETEVTAALKAIEGALASILVDVRVGHQRHPAIHVNLEKTTVFLCQAYLATVDGLGKLEPEVKKYLKDTDLLAAQSNPYRRMSANLYETKLSGEYYHIHGSLEASTTLQMIGLKPHIPELQIEEDIIQVIEPAVRQFSNAELETLNVEHRQAGVPALKHNEFLHTQHGQQSLSSPLWSVENLENETPIVPIPSDNESKKVYVPLAGIKVVELCRIIAGPVIGRILAEYGADVLKITSPNLSDVPFFQVDGNMGKHAAELDLKTEEGRKQFNVLLSEADVIIDGYRPGAIAGLGFGPSQLSKMAIQRGKGYVYVNENCFGYRGEWSDRPGWQQIADCVSGVAWEQGRFMGLEEPVVPPFPISDYGTGCIGAIAALVGLYHRATKGGSWYGKASLLQYDLLLFKVGQYPEYVKEKLRQAVGPDFMALRHSNSVDRISATALRGLRQAYPLVFGNSSYLDTWYSNAYCAEVKTVLPVVEIQDVEIGFQRASRPNGTDKATWKFGINRDTHIDVAV